MGKAVDIRPRGKRYETTLRVGSLANLALVSARAAPPAPPEEPPARVPEPQGQGGQWTWTPSWR